MKLLKWIFRIIGIGFLILFGLVVYDVNFGRLSTRPEMPLGAFDMQFKNGANVILVDVPDEKNSRDYILFEAEVPDYLKDNWSFCYPPTDAEKADYLANATDKIPRLDAICKHEVDGNSIVRGAITSIPKF